MKGLAIIFVLINILVINRLYAQGLVTKSSDSLDTTIRRNAIKTGIGIGFNYGLREEGLGIIYTVGFQRSYGKKNRFRINPNATFGEFVGAGLHIPEQYYSITAIGVDFHYDLLKYRALAITISLGGFSCYSRGLLENNIFSRSNEPYYFASLYFGLGGSIGLRIAPRKSKLAYEIRPINLKIGDRFFVGYLLVGIDIKL